MTELQTPRPSKKAAAAAAAAPSVKVKANVLTPFNQLQKARRLQASERNKVNVQKKKQQQCEDQQKQRDLASALLATREQDARMGNHGTFSHNGNTSMAEGRSVACKEVAKAKSEQALRRKQEARAARIAGTHKKKNLPARHETHTTTTTKTVITTTDKHTFDTFLLPLEKPLPPVADPATAPEPPKPPPAEPAAAPQ
jgi:hypothetical protein